MYVSEQTRGFMGGFKRVQMGGLGAWVGLQMLITFLGGFMVYKGGV
jgi:hypothetical protein